MSDQSTKLNMSQYNIMVSADRGNLNFSEEEGIESVDQLVGVQFYYAKKAINDKKSDGSPTI